MERRLVAASRLIAGLSSERSRWTADIEELDSRKERLVGDCLLTSSFLSYTGAFTFNYRHAMVSDGGHRAVAAQIGGGVLHIRTIQCTYPRCTRCGRRICWSGPSR